MSAPCRWCPFAGCDCAYQPRPLPGQTDLLDALEEK